MIVVQLLRPIIHDGKTLHIGQILELENQQGKRLINIGSAMLLETGEESDYAEEKPSAVQSPRYGEVDPSENKDELIAKASKMTNDQLRSELSGLGVPYKPADNKATLLALYTRAIMED